MKNFIAAAIILFAILSLSGEGVADASYEVDKTEYKDVSNIVVSILILETGWFTTKSSSNMEALVANRITYLREFDFPTDTKGFYNALRNVPGVNKPYAEDKNYIEKVRYLTRN